MGAAPGGRTREGGTGAGALTPPPNALAKSANPPPPPLREEARGTETVSQGRPELCGGPRTDYQPTHAAIDN